MSIDPSAAGPSGAGPGKGKAKAQGKYSNIQASSLMMPIISGHARFPQNPHLVLRVARAEWLHPSGRNRVPRVQRRLGSPRVHAPHNGASVMLLYYHSTI